ncbi:hypothetical protein C7S14_3214 [Burkholderia cepacia]|nr:hypothetical protein C7S14_3214 [Burkholderia cepacia]
MRTRRYLHVAGVATRDTGPGSKLAQRCKGGVREGMRRTGIARDRP